MSGAAHCNLEVHVDIWRQRTARMSAKTSRRGGRIRRRAEEGRKERRRNEEGTRKEGRRTSYIKFNNPHLTGGEKCQEVVSSKSVLQKCLVGASCKSVKSERFTKVSTKSVLQKCQENV